MMKGAVSSLAALYLTAGCSPQYVEAVGKVSCAEDPTRANCASGGMGASGGSSGLGGGTARGGAATAGGPANAALSLIHRYSFDGVGTVAADSVGDADGTLVNARLDGGGGVVVADDRVSSNPLDDEYIDLPNHLVSSLRNATFEAWVTWNGGGPWQRIFDFGEDQTGLDGSRTSSGRSYLFLAASNYPEDRSLIRLAYARVGVSEIQLDATQSLPTAELAHVAVVFDADKETLSLYLNGTLENFRRFPGNTLQQINDVNNWLGRSNFFYDPIFNGVFEEFRIYSSALSESQISASFAAGADAVVGL